MAQVSHKFIKNKQIKYLSNTYYVQVLELYNELDVVSPFKSAHSLVGEASSTNG